MRKSSVFSNILDGKVDLSDGTVEGNISINGKAIFERSPGSSSGGAVIDGVSIEDLNTSLTQAISEVGLKQDSIGSNFQVII